MLLITLSVVFKVLSLSALQSKSVSGTVNITCDAWQAGNTDGYFVVTGHWIEENSPMAWECKSALLGFTKVNNAHNGKCLGGALFKVLDRVGIAHKVCSVPFSQSVCLYGTMVGPCDL
jgi:hypothetical protein